MPNTTSSRNSQPWRLRPSAAESRLRSTSARVGSKVFGGRPARRFRDSGRLAVTLDTGPTTPASATTRDLTWFAISCSWPAPTGLGISCASPPATPIDSRPSTTRTSVVCALQCKRILSASPETAKPGRSFAASTPRLVLLALALGSESAVAGVRITHKHTSGAAVAVTLRS